jgi:hypothetical protein
MRMTFSDIVVQRRLRKGRATCGSALDPTPARLARIDHPLEKVARPRAYGRCVAFGNYALARTAGAS